MATAVPINLTVEQGADFNVEFNLRDENGDYIDLSSYAIEAYFARSFTSSKPKYSFDVSGSGANPTQGLIALSLSRNITVIGTNQPSTASLKSGRYVYNVFITSGGGSVKDKVFEGVLTVNPGVL